MTKRRIKTLLYYLFNEKNNIQFVEIIKMFFDLPNSWKAKSQIQNIIIQGDYVLFYFKDLDDPLYYPKDLKTIDLYQIIVESFYTNNWHYYKKAGTTVEKKDVVVDCGAAEGLFSLKIVKRCKKLFLIEPNPIFFNSLMKTFSNFSNVEIIQKGIADVPGEAFLMNNGIESFISNKGKGMLVKIDTLDNLFHSKNISVNYIKADLEGSDFNAIKGAKNLIKRDIPKIAITTYHNNLHFQMINDLLIEINPNYNITKNGIYHLDGSPIMLHAS